MAVLKAVNRDEVGTHKVQRIRKQGKVPCVVYGHGEAPQHVACDEHEVELALKHGDRLLELDLSGQIQNVLVKEVQYDTFGTHVLHIDLARVNLDEMVEVTVAIVLKGTPVGVTEEGGMLQQAMSQVKIECAVRNIPDEIVAKVDALKLGEQLRLRELVLPAGARLLQDPELVAATVRLIAEEVAAPAAGEEGAAEPEVIGAKKEEEGEEKAE